MKQMGSPKAAQRKASETEHHHQQIQNHLLSLQRSSHPMPSEHTPVAQPYVTRRCSKMKQMGSPKAAQRKASETEHCHQPNNMRAFIDNNHMLSGATNN
jgi:hypothetical protein